MDDLTPQLISVFQRQKLLKSIFGGLFSMPGKGRGVSDGCHEALWLHRCNNMHGDRSQDALLYNSASAAHDWAEAPTKYHTSITRTVRSSSDLLFPLLLVLYVPVDLWRLLNRVVENV